MERNEIIEIKINLKIEKWIVFIFSALNEQKQQLSHSTRFLSTW